MSEHLRSAEDVAWEALSSDDYVLTPHEVLSDLIRTYAAEVREAARAEALAGFEWEADDCLLEFRTHGQNCQCFGPQSGPEVGRWVGPWEPAP